MKKLLLILLTTLSVTVSAQKIRFTDSRNHWVTHGSAGMEGCYFDNYSQYGMDTVIYMHTYKQLYNSCSHLPGYPGCIPTCSMAQNMLIREDTIADIVYYRTWSSDTVEHILYDYNMNVGDTILYNLTSGINATIVDSVINIDSIIINGVYHKVFTFVTRA